jgi:hypothetical protein
MGLCPNPADSHFANSAQRRKGLENIATSWGSVDNKAVPTRSHWVALTFTSELP